MNNKLGIVAFLMIAIVGIGVVSAFGFGGQKSLEDQEEMRAAIESNNFQAWKNLMEKQITQERFDELRSMHQEREEFRSLMEEARQSGNYTKIQELKEQFGKGKGRGNRPMEKGSCPFLD